MSRADDGAARIGELIPLVHDQLDRGRRAADLRDGAAFESDLFAEQRRDGLTEVRASLWQRRIPTKFQSAATSDFAGKVREQLDEWAAAPRGRNLLLLGPVGTGKTRAAIAACRAAHDHGLDVAFWPTVDLLDAMRPSATEQVEIADVADLDRLILDDVGVERSSDWTCERLDAVINRRWMDDLPTIATTNLEPPQLEERLGERTYSRLVDGAVGIRLTGADRRRSR